MATAMLHRVQDSFDNLDASDASSEESSDLQSDHSFVSSFSESFRQLCCDDINGPDSVQNFPVENNAAINPIEMKNVIEGETENAVDLAWLLQRCDNDRQLVSEVLKAFCQQGQTHLDAMRDVHTKDPDGPLFFHAVIYV